MGILRESQKQPAQLYVSGRQQKKISGMAKSTLTVIVSRGNPPAPIFVRCFKDGKHFLDVSSSASFNHHFTDLAEGDYDIYITGFNRKDGGDTTCFLSEEEIKLRMPDKSEIKTTEAAYLVRFQFTVGEE
ncbi:MAG TPA: hypothetical protein VF622_18825, partial [Segetibacter sp.]